MSAPGMRPWIGLAVAGIENFGKSGVFFSDELQRLDAVTIALQLLRVKRPKTPGILDDENRGYVVLCAIL